MGLNFLRGKLWGQIKRPQSKAWNKELRSIEWNLWGKPITSKEVPKGNLSNHPNLSPIKSSRKNPY